MGLSLSDFKAVIFDMDGVLIDSEPVWKIAMQSVFDEVGCKLTKKDFQITVGLRLDEVIQFWYNHTGWEIISPKEVEQKIVQKMVELLSNDGAPLIGVVETLKHLKQNNIKVGLATSSYSILIETVLEKLQIREYFDFTHSAEKEDYGKPHPAVYLTVAQKLNVSPLDCLVIEDSLNGIISAKAARMKVICIPEKTHTPEPKLILADYQFESMAELLKVI
jgi:mannitol-1-/sugar-/sorbitol-6-/2-deoxyglucose-6-phosphatase